MIDTFNGLRRGDQTEQDDITIVARMIMTGEAKTKSGLNMIWEGLRQEGLVKNRLGEHTDWDDINKYLNIAFTGENRIRISDLVKNCQGTCQATVLVDTLMGNMSFDDMTG